jgi:hypothetical protein
MKRGTADLDLPVPRRLVQGELSDAVEQLLLLGEPGHELADLGRLLLEAGEPGVLRLQELPRLLLPPQLLILRPPRLLNNRDGNPWARL